MKIPLYCLTLWIDQQPQNIHQSSQTCHSPSSFKGDKVDSLSRCYFDMFKNKEGSSTSNKQDGQHFDKPEFHNKSKKIKTNVHSRNRVFSFLVKLQVDNTILTESKNKGYLISLILDIPTTVIYTDASLQGWEQISRKNLKHMFSKKSQANNPTYPQEAECFSKFSIEENVRPP
ncbi:7860_t:CDS:2 [Cetraspora pellucida]|uniref:7860_t:CDS:1 n=1 Tax=Cetraspora pellucida TaxID=1433469 RepID=A0A9N9CXI9_9GLOM|nr:7860_t:CDS:2 [Cetraspora pellucida]